MMSIDPIQSVTPPAYVIHEDGAGGIVRMMVEGFYDRETLIRHFEDSAKVVTRWRVAGRPIRVLIDALNLQPHTPENQALVKQFFQDIYRPGDRVAILVGSNLVKMQMRRAPRSDDIIDFFVSEFAALKWLLAKDK